MKQNKIKITYYITLIINFLFTCLKVVGGIFGKSETLLVDGLNTLCEVVGNIISLIGNKISHKRSNKSHPFGYGLVEYIANLFVGFIIFALGIAMFIKTFISTPEIPNINLIYLLLVVIIGKLLLGIFLNKRSTDLGSSSLLVSAKQSFMDLYSSCLTLIVVILAQFSNKFSILKYSDFVGSILISFLIIRTGFKIIKENVLPLSGVVDNTSDITKEIEAVIEKVVHVDLENVTLIKCGGYYQAQVTVIIDPKISALRVKRIEDKIKKKIKESKYNIKYVFVNIELDYIARRNKNA